MVIAFYLGIMEQTNMKKQAICITTGEQSENHVGMKINGNGFHGDSERKKVIACSLGESRPIHWQWYEKSIPIGKRIKFVLNNGDMYIMSEKTSGFDWKKRNIKTLRHAAGEKYVK